MSILIKGIDMPKCLNEDILVVIRRDKAEVLQTGYKERIVEAIQIPTPHGRIIDIEKLKEEFAMKNNICKECDSFKKCDNKIYSKSEICENFIWVPTILEEEGE